MQSGERERAGSSRWQKTECRNVRVRVKPGQQVGEGQKVDLERPVVVRSDGRNRLVEAVGGGGRQDQPKAD